MSKTIIGLTGNIGTGKSAVMRFAAERGVLTIDADKVVHHILESNRPLQKKIGELFGANVLTPEGGISRAALGGIVFQDGTALEKLEKLLHPEVHRLIREQIATTDAAVVMIEAIKLLEGGLVKECHQIWVTDCGKLLQLQRLVIGRGMDEEEAFNRIAAQAPQEEKVAAADLVIDTSGSLAYTRKQVLEALETLPDPKTGPKQALKEEKPRQMEEIPVEKTEDIIVRRARPSDIPSILLLIHRSSGGAVKPKRGDILMSLSERGYLIGQQGSQISTVVGWYADKGFGAIDQMFIFPPSASRSTGEAVLAEIERTASELLCEAIFAFADEATPDLVRELLADYGFMSEDSSSWPRVWQQTFQELRPAGATKTLIKKLWNARVA